MSDRDVPVPAWDELPPQLARILLLDRACLAVFSLWAAAAWTYLLVAVVDGRATPGDWRVMVLAGGLLWAPYEVRWWARKVQVVGRLRRQRCALRPFGTRPDDGAATVDGGPALARSWRPLRQLLRVGGVHPWVFAVERPGEPARLYLYRRATRPVLASTWLSVPSLWVAEDDRHEWAVLFEPRGRFVKVCRRAPWHEAAPGRRVRWWVGGRTRTSLLP